VAAVAAAPAARARKRKPPPLAFYSVTMTAASAFASGSERAFEWTFSGAIYHPESNTIFDWGGTAGVAPALSAKAMRAQIMRQLQAHASSELRARAKDVPADQVEVILI